jgi:hypothetical protein
VHRVYGAYRECKAFLLTVIFEDGRMKFQEEKTDE